MGNRLRDLRLKAGWTHQETADAIGVSKGHLIKLERGERRLNDRVLPRAAKAFGVRQSDVIEAPLTVPLVGYVGAGAEAHLFGDGQGPFEEIDAPEGSTERTVAVEIRGESLGSFFDRWLVFYDDVRDPPTTDMFNKLCVIGVSDGRVLVKKLAKGSVHGRFTLYSQFEPPIYDVLVTWAARILAMTPR